jgi:hypothetical protein
MATPKTEEKKSPSKEVPPTEDAEDAEDAPASAEPVSQIIRLPPGTVLTEEQARELALDRATRVIVIAGPADCGKTTLVASLYELFQAGPVKAIQFAGCDTLPAFEQRCHLSRTDSENDEGGETARTPYAGPQAEYLHLTIQDGAGVDEPHIDFLLTDVSGEMFEHARNSTDECKQLTFLRRASHFVLLLDCKKALLSEKKWGMVQEARSLLQSCLDSSMLESTCCVTVVWAKWDVFKAANDKDAMAFVTDTENEFNATFGDRISGLKFHHVAARPDEFPSLKLGYGVRELLTDWMTIWPQARMMRLEPLVNNGGKRESELFAKRQVRQAQ